MRKHAVLTCILVLSGIIAAAQKYALIDQTLSHPLRYANKITAHDIRQKLLPVETRFLPELIKALKEIKHDLDNTTGQVHAKNFHFGCTHISGMVATLAEETRFNYAIQSDCDQMNAYFLICDAKFKNSTNSFIVGTWIKYLKTNFKKRS